MDEISTSNLLQDNLENEQMYCRNRALIKQKRSFERILESLLDRQLLSPREHIVDEIMDQSKKTR